MHNPLEAKERKAQEKLLRDINKNLKLMAASLDNLTAAITALGTAVDAAVTALGTGVPAAQVQAAADSVNAQTAKLNAALNPAPPTP